MVFGGLGALLVAAALAGMGYALLREPDGERLVWLGLCGGLGSLGAYLIAALQVERIVLHPDRIELIELGRARRSLRRDEIAGWRLVPLQYGLAQLVVAPRGQDRQPAKIATFSAAQAARDPWFAGLPDLDALDRQRAEAELLRSEALGADEVARRAGVGRADRLDPADRRLRPVRLGLVRTLALPDGHGRAGRAPGGRGGGRGDRAWPLRPGGAARGRAPRAAHPHPAPWPGARPARCSTCTSSTSSRCSPGRRWGPSAWWPCSWPPTPRCAGAAGLGC